MKKWLMLAVACLFAQLSAMAQKEELWDIYANGKAGATASTLTGLGGDMRVMPTIAGGVEVRIYEKTAIGIEVSSTWQGGKDIWHRLQSAESADDAGNVAEGPYEYRLHYINTSYFYKHFFTPRLNAYTGFSLTRLIGAKAEAEGLKRNIRSNLHKGDITIPVGVEYEYRNLTLDARYNWSFRHLAKSERAKAILGDARNSMFMLTLGYKVQIF